MMGDSDTDVDMSDKRIRKYYVGHAGPYIVNIRSVKTPLESKKIQKFIFDKYKHVQEVKQLNQFKLRIIFRENEDKRSQCVSEQNAQAKAVAAAAGANEKVDLTELEMSADELERVTKQKSGVLPSTSSKTLMTAREEANDLPQCKEWNTKYRVYIPEKLVEVRGVISLAPGHDIKDLMQYGCGKFRNSLLKEVEILEVNRIKRKAEGETLVDTSSVVVTFEGLVLPNVLDYGKLLIPVREYKIKQMFCSNCQMYNHTESMCNNKKVTLPENIKCLQCNKNDHESGSVLCPKRKQIEKKIQENDRKKRKHTYAEMLKILDPGNTMPNESTQNQNFPPMVFMTRKRSAAERKINSNREEKPESPQRKRPAREENAREYPPGFKNPAVEDEEMVESIVSFIKSLIMDLDIPPMLKQIINAYATPFLNKLVRSLTNSVMNKFIGSSWQTTENV